MRIFWLKSDYIVPPDTGGKIRTFNLMRELNKVCPVTYLACKPTDTPNDEPEVLQCATEIHTVYQPEEMKAGWRFYLRVLVGMASRLPYIAQKYRQPQLRHLQAQLVRDALARGEECVVLCDFLEMAENVVWELPCPKVLFQHNVESIIWNRHFETEANPWKKAYFGFECRRLARYEAETCNRFDLVFAVSDQDQATMREQLGVQRPLVTLETGVDTQFFRPRPEVTPVPGRLLFLGSMDWLPNIDGVRWFVNDVWPRIRQQQPDVTLDIVGRRPNIEVQRLAETTQGVQVVPNVPDVRPYLAEADLFIVPLRIGGGTRIKIYEAMAMARPVVSTTIGAEGLPVVADQHICLGDTPDEFARQVVDLLRNHQHRDAMAQRAHRLVVENYQWQNVAGKMLLHCQQLLADRKRGGERS